MPSELDTAFRILRGLLSLQDEPLQKERCTFVFDLQGLYVESKPFLVMLEQLRSRNPKFVLYGLAFVAEVALSTNSADDTHQLVSYLLEHKEKMQMNLRNQLFSVKYDLMEFNDLLGDEDFLESYN